MEYFVMPQVDKSASTYSPPVQYVSAIGTPSPSLVRPEVTKYGVSNDLLTSCDWSAVIHRPAEDSEPEDLPSTVDMDAIKEPATPLPPLTPCPPPPEEYDSDDEEEDSSDSGTDDDGASSSDSDSQSQDGSGYSSSWSDSESSDASRKPKESSFGSADVVNSPSQPTFSIRESNFEEGGLRLKISTKKAKSSQSSSATSSSSSSSSEDEHEKKNDIDEDNDNDEDSEDVSKASVSSTSLQERRSSRLTPVKPDQQPQATKDVKPLKKDEKTPAFEVRRKQPARGSTIKQPPPTILSPPNSTSTPSKQFRPVRRPLRPVRKTTRRLVSRKDTSAGGDESSSRAGSSDDDDDNQNSLRKSREEITQLTPQITTPEHDLDSLAEQLQEINQEDLAAILPDVGGGSFDGFDEEGKNGSDKQRSAVSGPSSSPVPSHLTSSSSESDTEQIVSDVISRIQQDETESQNKPTRPALLTESPSSSFRAEKPEVDTGGSIYSSNLLADFVEKTELLSRGTASSSSDNLKRTDNVSTSSAPASGTGVEAPSKRKRGRPPKHAKGSANVKSQQASSGSNSVSNNANGMPELEAYMRMDCSQSNVSPDSGIQSVAGSPAGGHHSLPGSPRSPPAALSSHSGPPILSKISTSPCPPNDSVSPSNEKPSVSAAKVKLVNGGKRGPGRPKGVTTSKIAINKRSNNSHNLIRKRRGKRTKKIEITKKAPTPLPPSAVELKVPPYFAGGLVLNKPSSSPSSSAIPTLPGINLKRSRGRPKKCPPVLEPNLPLEGGSTNDKIIKETAKSQTTLRVNSSRSLGHLSAPSRIGKSREMKKNLRITKCKNILKHKEHKHKRRKRHSMDFHSLDEQFIEQLLKLSEIFNRSCNISDKSFSLSSTLKGESRSSKKAQKSRKVVGKVLRSSHATTIEPDNEKTCDVPKIIRDVSVRLCKDLFINQAEDASHADKSTDVKNKKSVSSNSSELSSAAVKSNKITSKGKTSAASKEKPFTAVKESQDKTHLSSHSNKEKSTIPRKDKVLKEVKQKETSQEKLTVAATAAGDSIDSHTTESNSKDKLSQVVATCNLREKLVNKNRDKSPILNSNKDPSVLKENKEKTSSLLMTSKDRSPAPHHNKDKLLATPSSPAHKDKTILSINKDKSSIVNPTSHKEKTSNTTAVAQMQSPQMKRRVKKGSVDIPKNKDKFEPTSSNEQRLPLKKRHYLMSSASSAVALSSSPSVGDSSEKSDDSSDYKDVPKSRSAVSPSSKGVSTPKIEVSKRQEESTSSGSEGPEKDGDEDSSGVSLKKKHVPPSDNDRKSNSYNSISKPKDKASVIHGKRLSQRLSTSGVPQLRKRSRSRPAAEEPQDTSDKPVSLKRSQRIRTKNEEEILEADGNASVTSQLTKRSTRSMDECSDLKVEAKNSSTLQIPKTNSSRRTSKTAAVSSSPCPSPVEHPKSSSRTKLERKRPPLGVFEPSISPSVTSDLLRKIPDPRTDVLNKIKSKLLSSDQKIDVDEELRSIKEPDEDIKLTSVAANSSIGKKLIFNEVPVVKLGSQPAAAIPLVKSKVKRKKINRTGFPVKKKKKKKIDSLNLFDSSFVSYPPVLEDQTKLTVIAVSNEDSTPALSPNIPKPDEKTNKDVECKILSDNSNLSLSNVQMKTEVSLLNDEPVRPASKRIMELKAKSEAAGENKKRKVDSEDSSRCQSQDEDDAKIDNEVALLCELKNSLGKRSKRIKEELDDSDADSVKLRKKQPRWRKKYLPAGLFSDYFKEDDPRKPMSEKVRPSKSDQDLELLPPPCYCAKWVRQRRIPFQLPHDIWWLHTHNQLPGREAVPSWNYKKIRTNVYFDVKPSFSYEAQACSCKPTSDVGCGEECINRMVLAECSPQLCPCKEKCSNQKIQRHEWSPGLMKFMTKDKGWGVKTKYPIKKDDFILEYVGEVVSEKEFKARMASRYQNDTHHYCLNLDGGLVIDGHRMGGDGRFVNHSCEPNCEMQKWCVNGLFRMALFALREIEGNEELTYDYNFSLFNPTEGQPCKCGSSKCRGVIGGKYQRVSVQGGALVSSNSGSEERESKSKDLRLRKNGNRRKANSVDKKSTKSSKDKGKDVANSNALATVAARLYHMAHLKPLTPQQKEIITSNNIFLPRNLNKVKTKVEKMREAVRTGGVILPESVVGLMAVSGNSISVGGSSGESNGNSSSTAISSNGTSGGISATANGGLSTGNNSKKDGGERDVFLTQLNALSCPRSMRTRRLALAEDNPEMNKTARLACIFKSLYAEVTSAKDESGELLCANFMNLPSKRKFPLYYQRISKPIDFITIEQNINSGVYKTVESFDEDMVTLFKNNVRWHGRTTELGIAATRLRKIYNLGKLDCTTKLEGILGESLPASFMPAQEDPGGEEEDVIHCICGMFRDEGLMIQCERCLVWQHCYCVGANSAVEKYLCERCSPRQVDLEIPSQEEPDRPGQTNYLTLLRGDMQLKQGDTVYVLRDIVNEESSSNPKEKHTYKTIQNWNYTDCDIFKIERLWKDESGGRFAFGHHYLRPHETFHEPTRKFFPNELMRVPLYEVVPIDLVMGQCYVLDLNTFCKGRPIGCALEHLYVCEYRVDKYARMFAKIPKPKHSNICTKSYAFETFDVRLKPQRTYAPHGMNKEMSSVNRGRGGRSAAEQPIASSSSASSPHPNVQGSVQVQNVPCSKNAVVNKKRNQKDRLNRVALKLLSKLPSKNPLDLSYLLEPGRRQRKKPPLLAS